MINSEDKKLLKAKQKELNLSDEQCNKIIEYLKFGFNFTDEEAEFESYVLDILDREMK